MKPIDAKAQAEAYERRGELKVGDGFIWTRYFRKTDPDHLYISSGSLPHSYMTMSLDSWGPSRDKRWEIIKIYEGRNEHGPFFRCMLSDGKGSTGDHVIFIDGADALKMRRDL